MENNLVSIIIPTHNRYDQLFRAINSALNQTYKNIEIIVVDDNYNNLDLRKKIKDKINKDYKKKVKFLEKNEHLGGALARNYGVSNSNGDYIAFLDDDDEFYNNKIEKQLDCFSKYDNLYALIYCYGDISYPDGSIEKEQTSFEGWPIDIQMYYNIAGSSFMLMKKTIFNEIGGFEKIKSHQDGLLLLKILAKGYKIGVCKESLVRYYFHDLSSGITGITYENLEADEQYYNIVKKYMYLISNRKKRYVELMYYKEKVYKEIILKMNNEINKDVCYVLRKYPIHYISYIILFMSLFKFVIVNQENKIQNKFKKNNEGGKYEK